MIVDIDGPRTPRSGACLVDTAGIWPEVALALPRERHLYRDVAFVCWTSGTREELEDFRRLAPEHPGPVVAIVAEPPTVRAIRLMLTRCAGAVARDALAVALSPTLEAIHAGQTSHPRRWLDDAERPGLTPRERQILALLLRDLTNAQIAAELFVTESNVKGHLSAAFRKLGVRSRSQAVELIRDADSGLGPGILDLAASR